VRYPALRPVLQCTLAIAALVLWGASWQYLAHSLCHGEQLMGDPGTALLINEPAFLAYLAGIAAMTFVFGLVFSARVKSRAHWVVLSLSVPVAAIAFIAVATAGAESWYRCAH
jgi:hypothetical protein